MAEPWDGPNNSKFDAPDIYVCRSNPGSGGASSYLAVVGPNAAWQEAKPFRPHDLPFGGSRTIVLVETRDSGVGWSEPRDLSVEEAVVAIQRGSHTESSYFYKDQPAVTNVAMGDGQVKALPANLPRETLQALLTVDGETNLLGISMM